jgi:hypothetical protein
MNAPAETRGSVPRSWVSCIERQGCQRQAQAIVPDTHRFTDPTGARTARFSRHRREGISYPFMNPNDARHSSGDAATRQELASIPLVAVAIHSDSSWEHFVGHCHTEPGKGRMNTALARLQQTSSGRRSRAGE